MSYSDYFEDKVESLLKDKLRLVVTKRLPSSSAQRIIVDRTFTEDFQDQLEESISSMNPESVFISGRTIYVGLVHDTRPN